jgi:hypothetical protein
VEDGTAYMQAQDVSETEREKGRGGLRPTGSWACPLRGLRPGERSGSLAAAQSRKGSASWAKERGGKLGFRAETEKEEYFYFLFLFLILQIYFQMIFEIIFFLK